MAKSPSKNFREKSKKGFTRSNESNTDEQDSESEEESGTESDSSESGSQETSSEEAPVRNISQRRVSKASARRKPENRNIAGKNTKRVAVASRNKNKDSKDNQDNRMVTSGIPTSENSSSLRKRSLETDFDKIGTVSPPEPQLGQKRILSEAEAILTRIVSDDPTYTQIGKSPFKVTRPAQNTQIFAEPSIFVPKSVPISPVVLPAAAGLKLPANKSQQNLSPGLYFSEDQIPLDHQAAAYLTRREETRDCPFDYNHREFSQLNQYLSELTKNLSDALTGAGGGSCSKMELDHTLQMVKEFVETCFLHSFEAREYLHNARLGNHVQNLLTILKQLLQPRDLAFEEALSKINAGLKPIANREFKLSRTEVLNLPPKVLHVPPSYFLLLITKAGWLMSQHRFRLIQSLRFRLQQNLRLTPSLSFVIALDVEKEAYRCYPSLDGYIQYFGLVRELLSEISVSNRMTQEQRD